MSKTRDEMAEKYLATLREDNLWKTHAQTFKAGWDEALRSEPRVLALVEAARECLNTSYRETAQSHRVTEISLLKIREALAAFKEGK